MFWKRLSDLIIASILLLFLSPVLVLLAILIPLDSPGPIIFRQKRVGKNGNFFEIYKFRTMQVGTPDISTSQMQQRPSTVTKLGKVLRRTSLDELPQLVNVIKGDMSLVGPRPALYNQTELTAKRQSDGVLDFLPGITGWAQINGRDDLPDNVKVEFDKWYVDHWHYFLDWQIVFATFKAVLSRRGAI